MKPSIGRVVWYYTKNSWPSNDGVQPLTAQIAYVWSDDLINIGGFDRNGAAFNATSVKLSANAGPPADWDGVSPYATWMPYQVKAAGENNIPLNPTQQANG